MNIKLFICFKSIAFVIAKTEKYIKPPMPAINAVKILGESVLFNNFLSKAMTKIIKIAEIIGKSIVLKNESLIFASFFIQSKLNAKHIP